MSDLANLLPLVGIALLFWFLIIRPTTKRQKELARMQAALQVGDEVILTSGVYGVLEAAARQQLADHPLRAGVQRQRIERTGINGGSHAFVTGGGDGPEGQAVRGAGRLAHGGVQRSRLHRHRRCHSTRPLP